MTESQHNTDNILELSSALELIGLRQWTVECFAVPSPPPASMGAHAVPTFERYCVPSNYLPMIVGMIPHMYLQKVFPDDYASILCLHNPTFHTVSTSKLPIAFEVQVTLFLPRLSTLVQSHIWSTTCI
jgi:hypothetical protein